MGKWLELAAKIEADKARANSANSANSTSEAPNGTIGTNDTASLPSLIVDGLERLKAMPAPRMKQPEFWPIIVRDCVSLAADGWASRALALGWHPLNLWGVAEAAGGLVDLEGLGVWLSGRRVLMLDELSCIAETGLRRRAIFHRRPFSGAVLLWDLGSRGGGR